MTEKLSGVHGKKRMRDRSCLIEHVFGDIKEIPIPGLGESEVDMATGLYQL